MSGVGVSTIASFEGVQRTPIRANQDALARALAEGGAIFIDADDHGNGLRLNKTAETVRDLLLIASFPGSDEYRRRRAQQRIQAFYSAAVEHYSSFYGAAENARENLRLRVDHDMRELLDRVRWEIERLIRHRRDDVAIRFLEWVTDYLRSQKWGS